MKKRTKLSYSYLFQEGFKGVFHHGLMSFASVCVIVACLLLMGSFALVAMNVDLLITEAEQDNEILAYVEEDLDDATARSIGTEINRLDNVLQSTFVSRDEALADYREKMESEQDILEGIDENPLRHRYRVFLKDISLMGETVEQLRGISGVADVRARLDISEGFMAARQIIGGVALVIIVVLLAISIFIIANTVKLATFDRRDEIAIMKMVGATNGFIRFPFLIEGMILGLLGAIIAFFLQWGVYEYIVTIVVGAVRAVQMVKFEAVWLPTALSFGVIGLLIGVGGSVLTIRKYLKV